MKTKECADSYRVIRGRKFVCYSDLDGSEKENSETLKAAKLESKRARVLRRGKKKSVFINND